MKFIASIALTLVLQLPVRAQDSPTWANDVACLIYSHCSNCHHEGGIAPFSLVTYQEVYDQRFSVSSALLDNHMPPWPANSDYRKFAHENKLTDQEVTIILDWIMKGAHEGDAANAPTPPVYSNSTQLQTFDLQTTIPTYTNTATNDNYRCFVIPSGIATDKFIKAFEVIPGNTDMVHHVLVYQDDSNVPAQLDAADPGPGYTSFGGVGSSSADLIGGWVPGSTANIFPTGMGVRLKANTNLVLQVHYAPGTAGLTDSTSVIFQLDDGPNRNLWIDPMINHIFSLTNGPLYIPANETRTFNAQFTVNGNASLFAILPHMHLIGRSIKSWAVTPSLDTIPLVDIPEWDFHWQMNYQFQKPIKIPAGTKIYCEAFYDNTTANPENPNFPPQNVGAGEGTEDEMLLIYFTYSTYQVGDENMVIDTLSHAPHYLNCTATPVQEIDADQSEWPSVYPSPATDRLNVIEGSSQIEALTIYSMQGEVVYAAPISLSSKGIAISHLPAGVYCVTFQLENGKTSTTKFLKL